MIASVFYQNNLNKPMSMQELLLTVHCTSLNKIHTLSRLFIDFNVSLPFTKEMDPILVLLLEKMNNY